MVCKILDYMTSFTSCISIFKHSLYLFGDCTDIHLGIGLLLCSPRQILRLILSQNPDDDESYHANSSLVDEWIERLKLVPPVESSLRASKSTMLPLIHDMLSAISEERPSALVTKLRFVGGRGECCSQEREVYEAYEEKS